MSLLLETETKPDQTARPIATGLRNLDVLRAMAVLSVLFAHSTAVMTFGSDALRSTVEVRIGRFGVLLFFVHTALVLMMSMQRNSSISRFYIQRIFRIYPLSLFLVAMVLIFHIPPSPPKTFAWPHPTRIVENVLLVQNFVLPVDYSVALVIANNSLSSPMWSLPFEIQRLSVALRYLCCCRRMLCSGHVVHRPVGRMHHDWRFNPFLPRDGRWVCVACSIYCRQIFLRNLSRTRPLALVILRPHPPINLAELDSLSLFSPRAFRASLPRDRGSHDPAGEENHRSC